MALHPLAEQFASVAGAYERGRPDYAPAVVGALVAELGIAPDAPVLDLGAGTGKLSRALLAAGLDVVAVEPQAALRETLAAHVGIERALEGRAEAIPLPDDAVDAVTVADAFHWFDQAAALAEIRRVLRPGGGLAVLWTAPDWSGASWAHEIVAMLQRLRPEHPGFDGPPWQETARALGTWSAPREIGVRTAYPADRQRILDYLASVSWVAASSEAQRTEMLARAAAIVDATDIPAELSVQTVIGLTSPA